ncbi:bacterio-opsin activator domain-containing protein [Halorubrum lipolyticum]|uniref:Bacterio-opsin activator n=1 Tax=Halorubrum lipolyticum DSM 21995 TaxID=1227482 RepID=M0NXF1_9EURY|nr:bacterio-opsin activator domain-containing protein [Halorubrum lipolyticum]EMA61934.1 bacterio-opsin activator [Halorubrum lipolyticum DSM 21995]
MSSPRTLLVHPEDGIGPIESAFDAAGFDVTTAHTATAAVAEATTAAYDCVVSEYALPGDDGVSLAEAVADADLEVPVVLFTADDDGARAAGALERGAAEVRRRNGTGSIERLVSDVSARCTEGPPPGARQDISGREPSATEVKRAVAEAPVGISISDPDLSDYPLVYANEAWIEHTGYPIEEALGRNPRFLQGPGTDPETVERIAEAVAENEEITVEIRNYRRDGTPFWNELTVAPVYDGDGDLAHYVGFQNDVTDRKNAERLAEERAEKLASERQALDRVLGRVNGLLSEITRILVESEDAESIAERVCEEIAAEQGYAGGWIAEVSPATGRLDVTAASGVPVEPGTSIPLDDVPSAVPQAAETDEATECAAGNGADARLAPDAVGGHRLVVAPITYGDHQYGLLGIYGDEEDPLGRRERRVCESVGKMIANGLHSVETTRILTTDRVVELHVEIDDPSFSLSRIAAAVDGTVEHLGTTRLDDDACELYVHVDSPAAGVDAIDGLPFVEEVRSVSSDDEHLTAAVTLTEAPPLTRLAEYGVVVVAVSARPEGADVTLETRPEQDVRQVLDVFRAEYEGVTLRSRSERENRDRSLTEFAAAVDDRLTDRQRAALRTAELNGYFEWPRPVDGSEIAEQMGITRQTFHQHLRAAERKLVEAYVHPRSRN